MERDVSSLLLGLIFGSSVSRMAIALFLGSLAWLLFDQMNLRFFHTKSKYVDMAVLAGLSVILLQAINSSTAGLRQVAASPEDLAAADPTSSLFFYLVIPALLILLFVGVWCFIGIRNTLISTLQEMGQRMKLKE